MKRILCIADSCCDLVFGGMPRLPALGEEVYGAHFSMQAGGGANTPMLLGRLGVPTAFWTVLGNDLAGGIVKDALQKSGVCLVGHGQTAERTSVSAVMSTPRDRAFASYAGGSELVEKSAVLEAAIAEADIVHTYIGYCMTYPIAEYCRRHGALLSLDCAFLDERTAETDAILAQCDFLKLNEAEALRLSGEYDPVAALVALSACVKRSVVVTLGERGCLGIEKGEAPISEGAKTHGVFVDACGAGDAFAAGFLYGTAMDAPFSERLRLGTELAGRCVTWYGGCAETFDGMLG